MVIALSSMMALKAVKLTAFHVDNEDEEEKAEIDVSVQDCSNSIASALAMELLQSCTKTSKCN